MILKYADAFMGYVELAKRWHSYRHTHPRARHWRAVYLEAARLALEKHYDLNGGEK